MATYRELQAWVQKAYGWQPKTCWIAHCKELSGQPVRMAVNRENAKVRQEPCPVEKRPAIIAAFRHFGMIR